MGVIRTGDPRYRWGLEFVLGINDYKLDEVGGGRYISRRALFSRSGLCAGPLSCDLFLRFSTLTSRSVLGSGHACICVGAGV
jgi:hypothetical protein